MKQNTDFMSALMVLVKPLEGLLKLTFFAGFHREIQVSGNGKATKFGHAGWGNLPEQGVYSCTCTYRCYSRLESQQQK